MAPPTKTKSYTGFTYEKNNFTALVDKKLPNSQDFHGMMDFIKGSPLAFGMTTPVDIYYEVVEEMWSTAVFEEEDMWITVTIKGKEVCITCPTLKDALHLPNDTVDALDKHTPADIRNMLTTIGYELETENLGAIRKKGLRKEWNFLADALIFWFLIRGGPLYCNFIKPRLILLISNNLKLILKN